MKLDKPHSFTQEEAVARIKALTTYWDTRYGTRTTWTDSDAHIKGKVKGISFDGKFSVNNQRLLADVKVGFLAEKIGGKAYVERKLDDYLRPTTTLEALQARI